MLRDFIFHYRIHDAGTSHEGLEPGEMSEHEHLMEQDGKHCQAHIEPWYDEHSCFEVYFDDGNELDVYLCELEPVEALTAMIE